MKRPAFYGSLLPLLLVPLVVLSQESDGPSKDEMREMENSMSSLADMLKGLKGLKEKLPDRKLHGVVRVVQNLDYQLGTSTSRGQCTSFGALSLLSHSFEAYPLGAWESKEGWLHSNAQRDLKWDDGGSTATEAWRGDEIVGGTFGISTHDDETYSISFNSAAVATSIETHHPRSAPLHSVQGRCGISIHLKDLPLPADSSMPFSGSGYDAESKTRVSWQFWPNECKADEYLLSSHKNYDPVVQEGLDGEVQAAFVDALRSKGVAAGPEHVTIYDAENTNPIRFMLRVSGDHCLLPAERAIAEKCIKEGSQEGAMHVLLGGIQRTDSQTRATVRVVEVETGLISSGGKGDADGTGANAIEQAVEKALDSMDYKITCTKAVVQ